MQSLVTLGARHVCGIRFLPQLHGTQHSIASCDSAETKHIQENAFSERIEERPVRHNQLLRKEGSMTRSKLVLTLLCLFSLVSVVASAQDQSARTQDRIIREVRHELLMLPFFGVFDNITYKVEGGTVTLFGQV